VGGELLIAAVRNAFGDCGRGAASPVEELSLGLRPLQGPYAIRGEKSEAAHYRGFALVSHLPGSRNVISLSVPRTANEP
jgi:hypothetical protein